jgi:hypothetical protein
MNTSVTNYDIIIEALIYKILNPPIYQIYNYNPNSYFGTVLSKSVLLRYIVPNKGIIYQSMVYNIENKIVKYKYLYVPEEKRLCFRRKKEEKRKKKGRK